MFSSSRVIIKCALAEYAKISAILGQAYKMEINYCHDFYQGCENRIASLNAFVGSGSSLGIDPWAPQMFLFIAA